MDDEAPPSKPWAVGAWLLAVLGLLLPWWRVSYTDGTGFRYADDAFRLFAPRLPDTNGWAPHVTGALVVAAALLLFVRLAANSWSYEPPAWRRDLWIVTALLVLALASAFAWPGDIPRFWGGRSFSDTNATLSFEERARPGLGWWVALLATVACGVAAWKARATTPK